MQFGFNWSCSFGKIFENGGQRTDDAETRVYPLVHIDGSGELNMPYSFPLDLVC